MYDITDRDSFNRVKNWVKELRKFVQKEIVMVIAANKQDLARNQQIPHDESQDFAKSIKAGHFKTSAKAGKGVEQLFLHISRQLLAQVAASQAAQQKAASGSGSSSSAGMGARSSAGGKGRRSIIISDDPAPNESKASSCC